MQADVSLQWHTAMQAFEVSAWQALSGNHPFLNHAFLNTMEQSIAVGGQSGWTPQHLGMYQGPQLLAAMPVYLKAHSYGEYVFDWSWADAYARAGGAYYPKLLSAVPFSPVTGSRLLIHPEVTDRAGLALHMLHALESVCESQGISGAHVLFPDTESADYCAKAGWLRRDAVQFRWQNQGYADWERFLQALSHDKRKKIRQERKKVTQQGVVCRSVHGTDISEQDWALFYRCYCQTYYMHGSQPYLPYAFFQLLAQQMPEHLAMFVASQHGEDVACSLCIHNDDTLYGRYWGALVDVSCLHFELCYYQPQQFCIDRGLRYFEGGAQGVHKLARGFDPYPTCSYHWLRDPALRRAVADYVQREQGMVAAYVDELEERRPFKQVG